jgi:hypothetical protein
MNNIEITNLFHKWEEFIFEKKLKEFELMFCFGKNCFLALGILISCQSHS